MNAKERPRYVRVGELFASSDRTRLHEDVRRQMAEEKSQTILDESLVRQQEDWSLLAAQVVGGEDRTQPR